MSDNSTPVPERAKKLFGREDSCSHDAIQLLTRDQLVKLAQAQGMTISILYSNIIEILTIKPEPTREKIIEIASDMLEAIEEDDSEHEAFYGGEPRKKLLSLFPALRGEGDAA